MPLSWKIDEYSVYFERQRVRGWCHHAPSPIVAVEAVYPEALGAYPIRSYGLPSPDIAAAIAPAALACRFDEWLTPHPDAVGRDFALRFTLADGSQLIGESAQTSVAAGDPFHECWGKFLGLLQSIPSGTVLEIGSRARSAITHREALPSHLDYVGLDILPGPNVDVVGDAHALEALFGRNRFVAAMSFSVFEHLAMPWKVALELNHVLAPGGLVFTQSVHTWPLHEEPWDFWRFSRYSWQTIFNAASGFEVVEHAHGEPARIHACHVSPSTRLLSGQPTFLGSDSIVRKVSDTSLVWPVTLATAASEMYPKGELSTPPT